MMEGACIIFGLDPPFLPNDIFLQESKQWWNKKAPTNHFLGKIKNSTIITSHSVDSFIWTSSNTTVACLCLKNDWMVLKLSKSKKRPQHPTFFSDKTQDKSFPAHFPCGPIELPHYTVPLCGMLLFKSRLAAIWFWPFNLFLLAFLKYLKVAMFCSNKCLKKYLCNSITKLVCCHVPSLHSGCSCRQ